MDVEEGGGGRGGEKGVGEVGGEKDDSVIFRKLL